MAELQLTSQVVVPESPVTLTKAERRVYNEVGSRLSQSGHLDFIDGYALAGYAQDRVLAEKLLKDIRSKGAVYLTATNSYPVPNPSCAILDKTRARMARFEKDFGMTPAGRKALGGGGKNLRDRNADNAKSRWSKIRERKTGTSK